MSGEKTGHSRVEWITMGAAVLSAIGWMGTALLQGFQEQDSWERGARQEAYANFYGELLTEHTRRTKCEEDGSTPKSRYEEVDQAWLGIALYASENTYGAAAKALGAIQSMECWSTPDGDQASRTLVPISELAAAMRDDLGLERLH